MTENKLICPFCEQEYIITKDDFCFGQQRCVCRNPNCEFDGWHFPVKLITSLIDTNKKLDVAVEALKELKPKKAKGGGYWGVKSTDAIKLINTALEQINEIKGGKDVFD